MTLLTYSRGLSVENMSQAKETNGKSLRPVRNRRHTRRSMVAGHRPQKRLFTPEIKRYLKDWLVRRRENPYPNREEKKNLAVETGLTYIQICNWFANWRRKLKNVNAERNQETWSRLIRTYNGRVHGNVEQFSISSDDSIWSEPENFAPVRESSSDTCINDSPEQSQEYHEPVFITQSPKETFQFLKNISYEVPDISPFNKKVGSTNPVLLSKWLESAARFQPSESNYSWWATTKQRKFDVKPKTVLNSVSSHDRDEVEAALALTTLATSINRLMAP